MLVMMTTNEKIKRAAKRRTMLKVAVLMVVVVELRSCCPHNYTLPFFTPIHGGQSS